MPLSDLWSEISSDEEKDPPSHPRFRACVAAAVARQRQRERKEPETPKTWASLLQEGFFTHKLFYLPGYSKQQDYQKASSERARCCFSLIKYMINSIQRLFQDSSGRCKTVHHVVNSVIADDTDTRIRDSLQKSAVQTVCNTVQSLHVRYSQPGAKECWESLNIPTPMVVLAATKTGHIHSAMTAFSVVCANKVGQLMQNCGLSPAAAGTDSTPFRTEILTGDALKANAAAWRIEVKQLAEHNSQCSQCTMGVYCKCQVHQLNLIRKPMVLSISNFWTSIIRLAHLFEQSSFRHQFATALVQFLQSPNTFQSNQDGLCCICCFHYHSILYCHHLSVVV